MKLGINSGIWEIKGINLEKSIYSIKEFGFKYVDLLAIGSCNPLKLRNDEKKRIINLFQKKDLISSNMVAIPPGNISSPNKEEKEECMKYLKACAEFQAELGGKQILIGKGCGEQTLRMGFEEAWKNSSNFLTEYCEYLENLKMFLTLELEPAIYYNINNTYRILKMIEEVNVSNMFANIDIGHLSITRESPGRLKKLKNYILHIHISDCDGREHANLIIGTGKTLIKEYLIELIKMDLDKKCQKLGITMVAALELGVIGQNIEDIDFYIKESINYINNNVPDLFLKI